MVCNSSGIDIFSVHQKQYMDYNIFQIYLAPLIRMGNLAKQVSLLAIIIFIQIRKTL